MTLSTAKIHREKSPIGASLLSTAIDVLTAVVEVAAEVATAPESNPERNQVPCASVAVGDAYPVIERIVIASGGRWVSAGAERCAMSAEVEIAARCRCGAVAVARVCEVQIAAAPHPMTVLVAAIDRLGCYHVECEAPRG